MVLATTSKPPTTVHHKKRSGLHHKQSKHYGKPYWPYLPLALIVGVGIVVNALWAHQGGVLGQSTDLTATALLASTNVQRIQDHESNLQLSQLLDSAAQSKANDMVARNYWSHDTPDGATPWSFIVKAGYSYQAAGENLAYGFDNSNAVVNGWMNSVEHRANILNSTFTQVGFGVAQAKNYQNQGPATVVVALYAEPVASLASAADTQNVTTSPARNDIQPLEQRVARIQTLTPTSAPWVLMTISTLTTLAILFFVIRHSLFWHRALVRSEVFVVRHKLLDVAFVGIATAGFILTRSAGVIH